MNIYFDCEFTGLHQKTTLISIGLLSENGKTFYAECIDYDETQVDDWIEENVIKKLKYKATFIVRGFPNAVEICNNSRHIGINLKYWLSQFSEVQFISDVCHYDFVLLIDFLSGNALDLPTNISPVCHDINQDIANFLGIDEKEAFNIDREQFSNYKGEAGEKHNAFFDAKIIAYCYELTKGGFHERTNPRGI